MKWISVKDALPDKTGDYVIFAHIGCHCRRYHITLYRELMWINEREGYIAFDVKNMDNNSHEYFEYIRFYHGTSKTKKTNF